MDYINFVTHKTFLGLRTYVAEQGVELHARLIHDPDGKNLHRQPYGQPGQHIVSINRRHLNEAMITEAEQFPNVKFFFEHKACKVDLQKQTLFVQRQTLNH